jgi:hypothetical protein
LKKEGLFKKQGGSHKTWKKRWFVLDDEKVQYFDPKKKDKALVFFLFSPPSIFLSLSSFSPLFPHFKLPPPSVAIFSLLLLPPSSPIQFIH